jgi:hypothetical protein
VIRRIGRFPRPLAAILVVAALHFLAWAAVLPALQVPDEPSHFAYVQQVVETGERPDPDDADTLASQYSTELRRAARESALMNVRGNGAARSTWTDFDQTRWEQARGNLTERDLADGTGSNAARLNPPLYYYYAAVPYVLAAETSFFDRIVVMRLFNLPFYLVTVVCAWLLAGMLLPGVRWARALATLVVALMPQFAFISAGISPDALLTATWSVFAVAAVHLVLNGLRWPSALVLLGVAGASAYTHPRGAVLLILAPAVLGLAAIPRRRLGAAALAAIAAGLLLAIGAFAAVTQYTGALDATEEATFNVREFASYVWQFYLPRLGFMTPMIGPDYGFREVYVDTYYATFGWLEIRFPEWVYDVLLVITLAAFAGLVAAAVSARHALVRHWRAVAVLAVLVGGLIGALHYGAYRSLKLRPEDPVLVGRYLFPVITLFGCAVAALAVALPRRGRAVLGSVVVAACVLLALGGLGLTAGRFYA